MENRRETMKTHKFAGVTICVRRKGGTTRRYADICEVIEDHKGSDGQKWLLLKKSNGVAVVTEAMVLSENVDEWAVE